MIIKNHFQFWINKFPRIEGITFDNHYTEETWNWFLNNPNRVHIYWWDNYKDLKIYVCKASPKRPTGLDWGYIKYTGNYDVNGYAYTFYKMIKEYEFTR